MGETPPAATPQQAPSLDEIPRRVRQAFKLWDKARTRQLAHREVQKFLEALGVTVDGEAVRSGILKYGADGADGTLGAQECNQLYQELLATQAAAAAAAAADASNAADAADANAEADADATAADASTAAAAAPEAPAGRSGADGIQRAVQQLRAELQRVEAYGEQGVHNICHTGLEHRTSRQGPRQVYYSHARALHSAGVERYGERTGQGRSGRCRCRCDCARSGRDYVRARVRVGRAGRHHGRAGCCDCRAGCCCCCC